MPSQNLEFQSRRHNPELEGVIDIEPSEVWEKRSSIAIVDVRRPDEFTGPHGHIPGAIHIILDTLPDHLDDIPSDKPVVFVCAAGARSGRACAFALHEGLTNVYN